MWNHQFTLAARRSQQVVTSARRVQKNICSRRQWKSSLSPIFDDKENNHSDESFMEYKKQALQRLLAEHSTATGAATDHQRPHLEDGKNISVFTKDEEFLTKKASPSELTYTGGATIPVTSHLHIVIPEEDTPRGIWPIFRVMVSTK
jgi:hypothetical protein